MFVSLLKHSHFRHFFISDIISGFGVGMSTIGANWYLMDQTGSITSVGFMLSLNLIAGFLISSFAGTLIDKWNRKTIILWAHGVRAIALLLIAGAFLWAGFRIELLYAFAILNGIGWTVYMSASRSLVQEIVPEDDFIHGNSLIEISLQVGMFMAGALSGILYKYASFELILFLNALSFIAAIFFFARMPYAPIQLDNKEEPFFETFRNGISYLMERPYIFWLGIVSIIPLASTMVYNVVLPGYVSLAVGGDSVVFGFSDMFYGVGALVSGFIAAALSKRFSHNLSILLFFVISILVLVVVAFNTTILLLYAGSMLIGLTNSSLRILMTTTLMEKVSKTYMGRSTSVWMAISLLLQTISATGLGIVIDRYSPGLGFMCMSGLMIVGLVMYYALNSRKQQQKTMEA